MKKAYIGGQAVIEGVMMKYRDQYAVAVRTPDQRIDVKVTDYVSMENRSAFYRIPIVRGVVNFAESLSIGMKTLMHSASFFEEEDAGKSNAAKKGGEGALMTLTLLLSLVLAIGLFIVLPALASEFLRRFIENQVVLALIEGVIRLVIFILYVWSISLMKDMRRVYMYHGAEHKTINCFEAGVPLTPENVKNYSRYHKRCGTSFLFIVMLISILFFMVIRVDNAALRIGLRLLLIPAIAGVSYEVIRFAGRHDNWFVNIISAPGKLVQKLTTREPDLDMIEVAIASVDAVIDWRAYQEALNAGELETNPSQEEKLTKKEKPVKKEKPAKKEKPVKEAEFIPIPDATYEEETGYEPVYAEENEYEPEYAEETGYEPEYEEETGYEPEYAEEDLSEFFEDDDFGDLI